MGQKELEKGGEGVIILGSGRPFLVFVATQFLIPEVGFWRHLGVLVVGKRVSG